MIPKFRIWDKTNKEMLEWEELDLNKERGEDEITIFEPTGQFAHPIFFYDAMQSTGLIDKNGVEIYEGDIVKAQDGTNGRIKIFVVKRDESNGGFYPMTDYDIGYHTELNWVIGNVFEDKNLLSEE